MDKETGDHCLEEIPVPTCSLGIIAVAKLRKQPKCPLMDKQIRKMRVYIHNVTLLFREKERKFTLATTMVKLEGIIPSEINQTER